MKRRVGGDLGQSEGRAVRLEPAVWLLPEKIVEDTKKSLYCRYK